MAVSRRLRYEILRRDNHQCRYCGASAPDAKLTIDHVVPTALGGSDESANLVTACSECNSGKSSSSPDAPIVDDVSQEAIRWRGAMQEAARRMATEQSAIDAYCKAFWNNWPRWAPDNWQGSLRSLYEAGLPKEAMLAAIDIAIGAPNVESRFKYFCGVCWRRVAQLQEAAAEILASGEEVPPGQPGEKSEESVSILDAPHVGEALWACLDADTASHLTYLNCDFGVLVVRADSTAWATQVRLLAPKLLRKVNQELGHPSAVAKIEVLGPRAKQGKAST